MDESFVAVMRSEDLVAGDDADPRIRRVRLDGTTILIARLRDGAVVAFAAACPHQGTDLEQAKLWDGNVRCARHNYLYDPRTGENIQPTRDHRPESLWKLKPGYLPTYPVVENGGWIHVGPCHPPPPSYDPALEVPPAESATTPQFEGDGGEEAVTEELRVTAFSTFDLRLPISPLPGYEWQVEVEGPLTVLDGSGVDEATDEVRVSLSADGTGQASIICGYCAPWEAEPSQFRHYRVEIVERG